MNITLKRERYQNGSLTIERRNTGSDVWIYRWRESSGTGKTVQRKRIIGDKKQYPNATAARKAIEGLRIDINADACNANDVTVAEVIAHYSETELSATNKKTARTKDVYRHHLQDVIAPRWGNHRLCDVKSIAVEKWFEEMTGAPGTKAKTKGVFSVLFQHAMRHEWSERNPIKFVRQGAMPQSVPDVLDPVEVQALLSELRDPFRTIILVAAVTGLRRGELFGLKWQDVDFAKAEIRIERSLVDQVEGPPKTLASRNAIPMAAELAEALSEWRTQTSYVDPEDWVFASPSTLGEQPYWPNAVLKRHVLPAALRAGITKRIGWHTFRRSLATQLHAMGASVKTTQELLRHASPGITLGVYAKAVTADKRAAQAGISALLLPKSAEATHPR